MGSLYVWFVCRFVCLSFGASIFEFLQLKFRVLYPAVLLDVARLFAFAALLLGLVLLLVLAWRLASSK